MSRKRVQEKKKFSGKKKFVKGRAVKQKVVKPKKREIREWEKQGLIREGIFIGNQKGFGFVEVEGEEEDIFIPANATGTAMHQDHVQVLLGKKRQKAGRNGYSHSGTCQSGNSRDISAGTRLWFYSL